MSSYDTFRYHLNEFTSGDFILSYQCFVSSILDCFAEVLKIVIQHDPNQFLFQIIAYRPLSILPGAYARLSPLTVIFTVKAQLQSLFRPTTK